MDPNEAREVVRLASEVFESRAQLPNASSEALAGRVDEIAVAARALLDAGRGSEAAALVGSLSSFWQVEGLVERGREVTEAVIAVAGDLADDPAWARAHLVLGELAFRQGDQRQAELSTVKALEGAAAQGDTWLEAEAETNLSRIAFRDGDAERIRLHASRVAELADGRLRLLTKAEHMLGWAAHTAGDLPAAMQHFETNAGFYRELGDLLGEAMEFANLADLAMEAGDDKRASAYLVRAMSTPGIDRDHYLAASLVMSAGVLASRLGAHREAVELMAGADAMYAAAGLQPDPGGELGDQARRESVERLGPEQAAAATSRGSVRGRGELFEAALEAIRDPG